MSNGLWRTFDLLKGERRRTKDTFDDVQEWLNSIARKTQNSYERRLYDNHVDAIAISPTTKKSQNFLSRDETTTTTGFIDSDTVKSLTPVQMDRVTDKVRGLPGNLNIDLAAGGKSQKDGTSKKKKIKKKTSKGGNKKSTIVDTSFKGKLLEKEMLEEEKLYSQTYFEPLVECRLVYFFFIKLFFTCNSSCCLSVMIFIMLLTKRLQLVR